MNFPRPAAGSHNCTTWDCSENITFPDFFRKTWQWLIRHSSLGLTLRDRLRSSLRSSLRDRLHPRLVPADLFLNVLCFRRWCPRISLYLNALWCCTAWNLPVWPRPRDKILFLHVILYIRLLVHLDSLRLFFVECCCWQPCSPWALGIGNTESTYMVLQCHDYDNVLFVIICCCST